MLATFTALAEPNRLRIVELLREGPQPVGEIGARLGVRQPQVSKHLQTLYAAGLVDVRADAQRRLYELAPGAFRELDAWLGDYRTLWAERLRGMDAVITELRKQEAKEKRPRHDHRKRR